MTRRATPNPRRRVATAAALALALTATHCGPPSVMTERDDAFEQGVAALGEGEPELALRATWKYFKTANVDDPRYDRSLRLLARSAERLGLRHAAATWWLAIASGGRDPELLPVAVEGLQRVVEGGPYDAELLVGGFLAAADLGTLPPQLMGFVDYYAGLDSQRRGDLAWAADRFRKVPRGSPYWWRVRYVTAVGLIAHGKLDDAQKELEAVVKEADDPNRVGVAELPLDLRLDVERALARLHFEAGRWELALEHYDKVRALKPSDATLLLEMAWTHFYRGDTRRALGLLLALDAPEFQNVIAPERFLLEAICLRRLCQFDPAREAVTRLRQRYADAYRELEAGTPLVDDEALAAAAEQHPSMRATADLDASLRAERKLVQELAGDLEPDLVKGLDDIYARALEEVGRRKREILRTALGEVADELLAARDAVGLVTHELAVALLRGRRRPEGPRERDPARLGPTEGRILYRFDGEYWSDELDDLLVMVEDRCIE